ncbi:MAG: putative sensory box sensor histidine kinase/response regulator [Burkholderiales bacterium]|jgi:PAS domain S-box-containing protein|nr:putative sensory box sensor histidine kinase/response regulator [Burkholderiales bacterium]
MPNSQKSPNTQQYKNEFLERILAVAPGHIYWKNLKGEFLGCNDLQAFDAGFKSKEDMIGLTDYDMPWSEDADFLRNVDKWVMRTGETIVAEEKSKTFDGRQAIWLSTKKPLYDEDEKMISIVGTSVDITAHKDAERLRHENRKLESQNKLNQIFLEKLAAEAVAEQLRLENEAYLAQKKEQTKFFAFVDKIQRDIQNYKIEALTEKIGIAPKISDSDKRIKLTKRELDVLYYLSLNKSPKDIAQIITIIESKPVSDSTINAIINKKLYPKFEVFNIGQLIEKAIMLNQIPFLLDN